ncbi:MULTISPECIES: hypothetical protein [Lysinibacillus]|uniref:hypothetical protein n=1 Tax=Lysinibacillus TaxID=400634 RepID=UPI00082544AD|nr:MULTISPECIES: hypothetical protein [Lysinibacillus]MCT1538776.1 hypothetical protein [Lysinibacillus capsici]MCT1569484.1 hypothetical protein [Lysinibacillus capsici]MCT1646499.1 hypothetical protein [Lysinibacillus capsici]MCT1724995.1 hypothetical protein [Lysinibacillus capsici]MCT1784607.1 hypothetical protein [Lysinibacillus capsici]
MERSTMSKLILVLFIGLVMLGFMIKMFFYDGKNKDDTGFEGENEYSYTEPVEEERTDSETETDKDQQIPVGNTEIDYDAEYGAKFGEDKVQAAEKLAEKVMQAWLENNTDMEMWKEISTAPFLIVVQNEVMAPKDQLTRKVQSLDVSPTKASGDQDIQFMVYATWDVLSAGKKVREQSNMYKISLTLSESGEWFVKELSRV